MGVIHRREEGLWVEKGYLCFRMLAVHQKLHCENSPLLHRYLVICGIHIHESETSSNIK